MKLKYKLFALTATGSLLAASFLGIQTFYTDGADTAQVSVRTPTVQSANFSGGGYESTSSLAKQTATAIPLASSTTGSLQSSLENESAERKTQDEKISKSIGAINNTLLGYIGSASTSRIGDGTLRGAIGNTSIAGIGSENNITSAISSLNSDIITNTKGIAQINKKIDDGEFKFVVYTREVSMGAGQSDYFYCPVAAPTSLEDYTVMAISPYTDSINQSVLNCIIQSDGRFALRLQNHINSTQKVKIYVRVLYKKL